ncbi:T9SS type B sorting domain-containing protein [Flavobacteriaceae bacterium]|nr:T9SS type B sorting domain-containing protein [Flavobacteriaceae bacterium]
MKHLQTLPVLWLLSFFSYGQIISVNDASYPESSYGPEQLIKDVLISSDCSTASNFSSKVKGAPTDLPDKSYGYFKTPAGSTFPFTEGIILTTGKARPIGNTTITNTISGVNSLTGDSDLENALNITQTNDATFFKFNFKPQVDEISFRFLMGSEEYDGNTECQFADGFAFLLREVGTQNYTNLAVLPDGTPVNVTNINNSNQCRKNAQYFEGYNPTTTNFGGHTKILIAKSAVTPGKTYEIKLVVADHLDSIWDSAIFLEAGSFDLGGDLGPDQTITNGNPGCDGSTITLDAKLTTTNMTFKWYKNNVLISGATNSTLDVTAGGTYKFIATTVGGCTATDEVEIEFTTPPVIDKAPKDLLMCDTDGDLKEQFDFSGNSTLVLGSQNATDFPISFHKTQADANGNLNPLTTPYTNVQQNETIWLRIADKTQTCYKVTSFKIEVQTEATANALNDYELCDDAGDGDDTNGVVTFDLTTKNQELLGNQQAANFNITFYKTQAEADAGTAGTEINTTHQNTSNPQTIFARVENVSNSDCYDTTSLKLVVNSLPKIVKSPEDILLCDPDNDLKEEFDFSANEALVLGTQNANDFTFTYHKTQADAEGDVNPLTIPYTNTQQIETIWLRISSNKDCGRVDSFKIEVQTEAVANTLKDYELCDNANDGDDANGKVTFDLTTKNQELIGNQQAANFNIIYYKTQAEADDGTAGTEINTTHQNMTNPETVFVRIENKINSDCYDTTSLKLVVNPLPVVKAEVTLKQCDTDSDGFIAFNLNEANNLISQNHAQEVFTFYETEADANADTNPINNPTAYTNQVGVNDEVFVRIETNKECHRTAKVKLIVGATQLDPKFQLDYEVCDDKLVDNDDTNAVASFDFSDATAKIKAQLPQGQNLTVTYYESEADALAELNAIADISDHRNVNSPKTQKIFVRVDSDDLNACLGLGHHITLKVNPLPIKQTIPNYILCNDNEKTVFDLTTITKQVQGNQTEDLHITYHLSEQDAINNIPIPNIDTYTNVSNPQTIFARVHFDPNKNQILDTDECVRTDISFKLQVNLNPTIHHPDDIDKCATNFDIEFDLTERKTQITGGDNTITLSYFASTTDITNNNPIANPVKYAPKQQNKTVFVVAEGQNKCTSTVELELNVILYDQINKTPDSIEECEIDNNGFDAFDLTIRETQILNNLDATKFEFTYYEDKDDAEQGNTNTIKTPTNFINTIKFKQTIYVRIKPKDNDCFQVVPLETIVNQVPEIDIEDRYLICFDSTDQLVDAEGNTILAIPPIDTTLDPNDYTFQWYAGTSQDVENDPNSVIIQGETGPTFNPTKGGDYTVLATNKVTLCRIPASTIVIESFPAESVSAEFLLPEFSTPNKLKVEVIGKGDYEYALNDGPWQKENILTNVYHGEHSIHVRDRYGCAVKTIRIVNIDYPKYFTPNGDGYHDTWNISSLKSQANAKIYIFDRYGKLLKELSPASDGWNGTFNGQPMPTSDYWFLVEYESPTTKNTEQFRAHFTLKR